MTFEEAVIKARELAALPFQEHRRLLGEFSDEDLATVASAVGYVDSRTSGYSEADFVLLHSIWFEQLGRALVKNLNRNVLAGRETP